MNLENKISEWRRQMLAAGIKLPVPLEELESHLREAIEQNLRAGFSDQVAFDIAARQIGNPKMLKSEFKRSERTFMNRRLIVLAGIVGLLLGTMMILPALGKHKQRNQVALSTGAKFSDVKWASDETYGLALGIGFFIVGAGTTFFGSKNAKPKNV